MADGGPFARWFWSGSEASPWARALRLGSLASALLALVAMIVLWNDTATFQWVYWVFAATILCEFLRNVVLRRRAQTLVFGVVLAFYVTLALNATVL